MLTLRPLAPDDAAELRRIRETPAVRRWWDALEDDFPLGDEPEAERFTIVVHGRVASIRRRATAPRSGPTRRPASARSG
jgi:hypothetical protein